MKVKVLIFLFLIQLRYANACDCTYNYGFEESDLVFSGKLLSIKEDRGYQLTLDVNKVEKGGIKTKQIVIYTGCLQDGCCGMEMLSGHYYKIFAKIRGSGLYEIGPCSQTQEIAANK